MSARDKLILGTVGLMQRRGVAAAGVADILEQSGVSRRSIYLNFAGGKPELIAEATRWSGQWIADQITEACADRPPHEALSRFVEHWTELLRSTDFEAGCPVAAAATARSVAPEATDIAGEAFARWHDILTDALTGHGITATRARSLATMTVAAVEGAVVLSLAQRTLEPLHEVKSELDVLLEHALRRN
ncbi:TetR/AcrR family transcriptional regulator [Williamsia sp. MIQD14]|uniref:TetR/AcrR family transcriptional regulator n=1 Tax=Williamsia sp. MIQD14 TaxID=3425703 RepID=UPI003DA12C26